MKTKAFLLLLVLCFYSSLAFTENFPATYFNSTCNIVPASGFTKSNFEVNGTVFNFNHKYYCLRNSSWDGRVRYLNDTSTYNTKNSLLVERTSGVAGGAGMRLVTFLSSPEYVSGGSKISYYGYKNGANYPRGFLQLYDSSYNVMISLPINADSSFCDSTYGSSMPNCCNISASYMNPVEGYNYTYAYEIDTYCKQKIVGKMVYAIGFSSMYNDLGAIQREMMIDDIDINFSENYLPNGSISLSYPICFNSSQSNSKEIPIDFNITDAEGDTLYYSAGTWQTSNIYKSFVYHNPTGISVDVFGIEGGIAENKLDTSIVNYVEYRTNDSCVISRNSLENLANYGKYFGFVQKQGYTFLNGIETVSYDVWQLALDYRTCTKADKSFNYALPAPMNYLVYRTGLWPGRLIYNFNLTYYDSSWNTIQTLEFASYNNSGKYNVNVSSIVEGTKTLLFTMPEAWAYALQIYNYTLQVWDIQYTSVFNSSTFSKDPTYGNSSVKYISYSIGDSTILYQDAFSHSGMSNTLNFTTTQPTFTEQSYGDKYYILYVSDEVHQPLQYTRLDYSWYLPDCNYFVNNTNPGFSQDIYDATSAFKTSFNRLCSAPTFSWSGWNGCDALLYMFLAFALILTFIIYGIAVKMLPFVASPIAMIFWTFNVFFIHYGFLEVPGWIRLLSGFIGALGIAILFRDLVLTSGDSSGGGMESE